MSAKRHEVASLDPFGMLPCKHKTVVVHITNAESMGDDIVQCRPCRYAVTFADLYATMFPKRD
jgi:hypothetical protein